jgi:hypothetical protein
MKQKIAFVLSLILVVLAGCDSPLLEKPAARGEEGKGLALIRLAGPDAAAEDPGTLSYRAGFPAGLTRAKLYALPTAGSPGRVSVDLLEGLAPGAVESAGDLSLPAGYYRLALSLSLDDGGTNKIAARTELILVSPGQTLSFASSFSAEDFVPGVVFDDLAEMKAYLEGQPANTKDDPYGVYLEDVHISDWGETGNPLGTLIDSLGGRYVNLDTGSCFGTAIGDQVNAMTTPPQAQRNYLVRLVLPDTIDTIGDYFLYNYINLKSVHMPDGLLSLGDYSFDREARGVGTGIETMDLSETLLTSLGTRTFLGCRYLEEIKFPPTLTAVGSNAFAGCSELVTIVQQAPLISVGPVAFEECSKLESIMISADADLGPLAFTACSSLRFVVEGEGTWSVDLNNPDILLTDGGATLAFWPAAAGEIVIPSGIKKLGSYSFNGNIAISSVDLGSELEEIEREVFMRSGLISLTLGGAIETIGPSAFYECSNLLTVSVTAENLTAIPASAFERSANLHTADLSGSNIQTIGKRAFRDCGALAFVSLPNTLTEVAADISADPGPQYNNAAFANTPALASFTVASGGPYSAGADGKALLKTEGSGLTLVFWPAASGAIAIPEGISKISAVAFRLADRTIVGNSAISGNDNITSVSFPSSLVELETIGDVGAFTDCYSLTTVDMSAATALTAIGSNVFGACIALNSVSFPPKLQSIGEYAFSTCIADSFTTIDLPATVTSIGEGAFDWCYGLTTLTIRAAAPPALGDYALPQVAVELMPDLWLGANWEHFYVPSASVDAYKAAEGWSDYADYIEAITP